MPHLVTQTLKLGWCQPSVLPVSPARHRMMGLSSPLPSNSFDLSSNVHKPPQQAGPPCHTFLALQTLPSCSITTAFTLVCLFDLCPSEGRSVCDLFFNEQVYKFALSGAVPSFLNIHFIWYCFSSELFLIFFV